MIVAPRRTLARLHPDEGARDGTWALVVYLLAAHTGDLVAAVARVSSLRSFDALLQSAVDVAIGLVVPFATMFAIELLLGRGRAHRAALCLVPMLLGAAALRLLDSFGVLVWPSQWLPGVIAAAPSLLFAGLLRPAIPERAPGGAA